MKIWEAFLCLERNKDGYHLKFGFEQLEGEFQLSHTRYGDYWTTEDEWDTSPVDMKIDTSFSFISISQGFDRELSEKEQKEIEIKMKVFLKEYLRKENEKLNKEYIEKMNAIKI